VTPEQILADLRDIHVPEAAASAATAGLVLWPLVLVLLAALAIAWLIWRRRSIWRREFADDLRRIEETAGTGGDSQGWARLGALLKRLAVQGRGRSEVARLNGEPWLRQLDAIFATDLFTKGPGRGLITFPYRADDLDDETARRSGADLEATIRRLRSRPPRHGMAG
jgi:hypothetical protein